MVFNVNRVKKIGTFDVVVSGSSMLLVHVSIRSSSS